MRSVLSRPRFVTAEGPEFIEGFTGFQLPSVFALRSLLSAVVAVAYPPSAGSDLRGSDL
jgi:hypothetical protein